MENRIINTEKTLFGFALASRQYAILNHLVPSILACILFIFIIAIDIGVVFRHYKDNDPIWASLTIFFMYLPAIGSFIIITTDGDYWPEPENGMTSDNLLWLYHKVFGFLFFPVYNIWRFAERIFWSIEAIRSNVDETVYEALTKAIEYRVIELYVFLQAYLHCLPQVLLQLHILMRHNSDIAKESKITQALCIILNLSKVAVTTTYYQRFRAQKLTGTQYPWLKKKKLIRTRAVSDFSHEDQVMLRKSNLSQKRVIEKQQNTLDDISRLYDIQPEVVKERRRSSDIYLEPEPASNEINGSTVITDNTYDEVEFRHNNPPTLNDETKNPHTSSYSAYKARFSSMLGFNPSTIPNSSISNFNIKRVTYIKGLQEDDMAGRTISFLWWFTFLLGRVLAISAFGYFFMKACIWLLISHVIIVIAVLFYDVKTDNIKRDKSVFFLFIGVIYIFCIIEFKIRFKKTNLIYMLYFGLTYLENIIMCLIWYCFEIESLETDYWYRYIFYAIVASTIFSISSMTFYHILNKPKSVQIRVET
ncbi:unnamed protein product [Ceutorhynchus assimilis]|uniref:XK-related protein n=1 Tax=Ceutorhynchus assimilis TaxID=467358 RepID=A0A9N9QPE0_9CUCU|nr:unnamed protein product [Ceutorhynchus assimilis]